MYLQNEEVTGKHYLVGNKIIIGNNVDNTRQSGDFVIKSKSNVTMEISDCLELNSGFSVEVGAEFEVKLNN